MAVTREQLYAEVWAEPAADVAKRYGVSGSFLVRVCKRLNVPRPPRGYWAAVKGGHAPPVTDLPPARAGDEKEWTPGGGDGLVPRVPTAATVSTAPTSKATTKRHPLLFGAEEELEARQPTKEGYLRPKRQLFPDIFVSREQMNRAVSLASRLYNELQARGGEVCIAAKDSGLRNCALDHRLDLTPRTMEGFGPSYPSVQSWRPFRPTVVFVGDVAIALTIFELSEYVTVYEDWRGPRGYVRKSDGNERRDMPSGRLAIRANAPYRNASWGQVWREMQRGDLVGKIPEIANFIVREAPDVARLAAEGEVKATEWERKRNEELRVRERERIAAVARAELAASGERLAALIAIWRRGQDLEAFLNAAAGEVAALDPVARELAEQRLARAREALAPMRAIEVLHVWSQPGPQVFNVPFPPLYD